MKTILICTISCVFCINIILAEKAIPRGCASFVPEFTGTKDPDKKIAIAKDYLTGTNDETLKRWVYYYLLPVSFENDKYYRMAYDLLLKEGKFEWAMDYLDAHGMYYPNISKWAMDALLELKDEKIIEAFKTDWISLSELMPNFDYYQENPQKLKEWYQIVIKALPKFGKSGEEDFMNALKNPEPYVRLFALTMLTNNKRKMDKSILPLLLEMTRDTNKEVSDYAKERFRITAKTIPNEKTYDYERFKGWLDRIQKTLPKYELSSDSELIDAYSKCEEKTVKDFAFSLLCDRGSNAFSDDNASSLPNYEKLENFFKSLLKSSDPEIKKTAKDVIKRIKKNKAWMKECKEFDEECEKEEMEMEKLNKENQESK